MWDKSILSVFILANINTCSSSHFLIEGMEPVICHSVVWLILSFFSLGPCYWFSLATFLLPLPFLVSLFRQSSHFNCGRFLQYPRFFVSDLFGYLHMYVVIPRLSFWPCIDSSLFHLWTTQVLVLTSSFRSFIVPPLTLHWLFFVSSCSRIPG